MADCIVLLVQNSKSNIFLFNYDILVLGLTHIIGEIDLYIHLFFAHPPERAQE